MKSLLVLGALLTACSGPAPDPAPPRTVYISLSEVLTPIVKQQVELFHNKLGLAQPEIIEGACPPLGPDLICFRYGVPEEGSIATAYGRQTGLWVVVVRETGRIRSVWEKAFLHEYAHPHLGDFAGIDGKGHSTSGDVMAKTLPEIKCVGFSQETIDALCDSRNDCHDPTTDC